MREELLADLKSVQTKYPFDDKSYFPYWVATREWECNSQYIALTLREILANFGAIVEPVNLSTESVDKFEPDFLITMMKEYGWSSRIVAYPNNAVCNSFRD